MTYSARNTEQYKKDGFTVIGRCIGGSHKALASYRLIADCMAMGEAAALAAKQAVEKNCALRGISLSALQQKMRDNGYQLEPDEKIQISG